MWGGTFGVYFVRSPNSQYCLLDRVVGRCNSMNKIPLVGRQLQPWTQAPSLNGILTPAVFKTCATPSAFRSHAGCSVVWRMTLRTASFQCWVCRLITNGNSDVKSILKFTMLSRTYDFRVNRQIWHPSFLCKPIAAPGLAKRVQKKTWTAPAKLRFKGQSSNAAPGVPLTQAIAAPGLLKRARKLPSLSWQDATKSPQFVKV